MICGGGMKMTSEVRSTYEEYQPRTEFHTRDGFPLSLSLSVKSLFFSLLDRIVFSELLLQRSCLSPPPSINKQRIYIHRKKQKP